MSHLATLPVEAAPRIPRSRRFLMCPPTYFDVVYAINAWMDPSIPVDRDRAVAQWSHLVDVYERLGHQVELLDPVPGLPDMVYAANGATMIDGRVLQARFATRQRRAEADHHLRWHADAAARRPLQPATVIQRTRAVNEAEGDFAVLADRVLAGYGFRTTRAAHRELAALTGRPVISLHLVDPRFYHLDVALTVLDDRRDHIAYYPPAFSTRSRRLLAELFPDAILATESDALVLGLNCVSDGRHVCVPAGADHLVEELTRAGYDPISIDLSELVLGGGSVKCCTQELRSGATTPTPPSPTPPSPTPPSPTPPSPTHNRSGSRDR